MSDEMNATTKANLDKRLDPTHAINVTHATFDKMLDAAKVEAVYGEPIKNGDMIIIPSAEIFSVVGMGGGAGGGSDTQGNGGGGGGVGGTGRVLSRPVAAIVITPTSVRVKPIVDVTKIALAAFTAGGFMFAMIARMSSRNAKRAISKS